MSPLSRVDSSLNMGITLNPTSLIPKDSFEIMSILKRTIRIKESSWLSSIELKRISGSLNLGLLAGESLSKLNRILESLFNLTVSSEIQMTASA